MRRTSSHEVDGFEDLEGADLARDDGPIEDGRLLGTVGANTAHKVRLGVHQSSQQIVQPRVEVLRQRRHRIVAVQSAQRSPSRCK